MKLNLRQTAICACLLDALTNKEIARAIGMSPRAASDSVLRIQRQFGARNRVELALKLQRIAHETDAR